MSYRIAEEQMKSTLQAENSGLPAREKFKYWNIFQSSWVMRMFPRIKVKMIQDPKNVKRLKRDLKSLKTNILSFAPPYFGNRDLNSLRIRIFKFPKKDDCDEFFVILQNKRYVCLNSDLLNKNYFVGLQYALHGIAHSFCHLNDDLGQEIFCEVVSYDVLKELLKEKNETFKKQVLMNVMKASPDDYNFYYRVGKELEKRRKGFLLWLNKKAFEERVSEKDERRIFYKLIRSRNEETEKEDIPELEKGFKRI